MDDKGGQAAYNEIQDEESSRKIENPVIVDEESASANLVRQRSGKKRRESEPADQSPTQGHDGFNDTINTDRYAL